MAVPQIVLPADVQIEFRDLTFTETSTITIDDLNIFSMEEQNRVLQTLSVVYDFEDGNFNDMDSPLGYSVIRALIREFVAVKVSEILSNKSYKAGISTEKIKQRMERATANLCALRDQVWYLIDVTPRVGVSVNVISLDDGKDSQRDISVNERLW